MIFKKFKPFLGPISFSFVDPDTGYKYLAKQKPELIDRIVSYRKQNELEPIENLSLVIDNYLCGLPENFGSCQDLRLERHLMGYVKGGLALLKNMLYKKYVSQEEADRRASICITCEHNVFPDKKNFIKWSDELAESSIGARRSKHHDKLGNCDCCSCPLRCKVWYGDTINLKVDERMCLINECWQK